MKTPLHFGHIFAPLQNPHIIHTVIVPLTALSLRIQQTYVRLTLPPTTLAFPLIRCHNPLTTLPLQLGSNLPPLDFDHLKRKDISYCIDDYWKSEIVCVWSYLKIIGKGLLEIDIGFGALEKNCFFMNFEKWNLNHLEIRPNQLTLTLHYLTIPFAPLPLPAHYCCSLVSRDV